MDVPEILFQYLKDIIYNTEKASLDVEQLPEEFQKLGQGMQLLGKWVEEAKRYSVAMARGDLSYSGADKENVFVAPMKNLQGTLRHLAWQTQQVAKGDYSQKVDFMGEFSESFNTMTEQLKERRDALNAEKEQLEDAFELVMAFANYTHNMIFIHSLDGNGTLFQNGYAAIFLQSKPDAGKRILEKLTQKNGEEIGNSAVWDFEVVSDNNPEEKDYYQVESYPIQWRQQKALVHIVGDDTERKRKENQMYQLVYADPLTGLHNRRYAMEKMMEWIRQGIPFVLSFIDVDYLKYCNDTLGHKFGDLYLLEMSGALGILGGVLCRIGGDEFMLLQTGKTAEEQNRELEQIREMVQREGKQCPQSFSYASCDVPAYPEKSLEEYISMADALMYQYKEKNRKPLKDVLYRDERRISPEA